jgi:hypothetical protein
MPNPVDIGTGASVTFGTSGFNAYVSNISGPNASRDPIETTHLLTTGGKTFIPGDLYDPGEITLDIMFDPSLTVPMFAQEVLETITITYPVPAGLSTGATWACSGFVTGHSPTAPLEDKMTASLTIKLSGNITKTAAA